VREGSGQDVVASLELLTDGSKQAATAPTTPL
jgi:hypothetical protein